MKRNALLINIIIVLIAVITVGTTLSLLIAFSGPVENTFTYGKVEIALSETTGNEYKIIPDTSIKKDPTVTVKGGSEDCWLFVEITEKNDFDIYMTYAVENGWYHLTGTQNIFYREVAKTDSDKAFNVIKDNTVSVKSDLTEEMLNAITNNPKLTFKAYAVQLDGIDTPHEAFEIIK